MRDDPVSSIPPNVTTADLERERAGLAWQTSVWDRVAPGYERDMEGRFAPIIEHLLARADVQPGHMVMDLGTGTGAVALRSAAAVLPTGHVVAVDISREMLALAAQRAIAAGLTNITVREGRAEAIPAADASCDRVLASLSLMYAIDKAAAAREIRRVLRPGGLVVAAVWAGPDQTDIVRFQQTAGSFAPTPPVANVGPGALADPSAFIALLAREGIAARMERESVDFTFENFSSAWDALAAVTTAALAPERRQSAQDAVRAAMWPQGDGPRDFHNVVQYLVGTLSPQS